MTGASRGGIAVLLFLLSAGSPASQGGPPAAPARVIHIVAERFDFFPSRIDVEQGEVVELRITSDDTSHGFRLAGAGINLQVPKRGRGAAVARFHAERPGRYTFECSRMCGAGHHFMRGTLVVSPPSEPDGP